MRLHVDSYAYTGAGNSGAAVLLIHGWGMHGGIWRGVAEHLAQHVNVLAVDLPGHGNSVPIKNMDLDSIVDALAAQFSEPLKLCGWSLGGQVALRWALRRPEQVERLMLIASTPCFAQRADWNHAMGLDVLQDFGAALQQNIALTLKRFVALQVRGGEHERKIRAVILDSLSGRAQADPNSLLDGLAILSRCDLRTQLLSIKSPTLVIAGDCDELIPVPAAEYVAQHIAGAKLKKIPGAAHVPFLSHPDECIKHVVNFMNEKL